MSRTDVDRLTSGSAWRWLTATAVAVLGLAAWVAVTDPGNRPYALVAPLLVAAFVVVAVRHRQWVEDGADGPVLVQRRTLSTRRVPLRTARSVVLRSGGGGHVQLVAQGSGGGKGDTAFAPVLALTAYVERSQPAALLDLLAASLDGSRAAGAPEVAAQLRRQSAHVAAGGGARTSPLAPLAADVTLAVGAAGALGGLAGSE